jgi:hypothetical protein
VNGTSGGNSEHLTKAEIGGVVGGVVGLVVVLGIVVWLIMRRLNEVLRFVKTRLEPGQGKVGGGYVLEEELRTKKTRYGHSRAALGSLGSLLSRAVSEYGT